MGQKPNTIDVIVGGQFGSESKGRVTAALAGLRGEQGRAVVGVRVAGPNAGHVVIDAAGNRFALRQIPVVAAVNRFAPLFIAAGSEIDIEVLDAEIAELEAKGHRVRDRLYIDREATILEPHHRDQEGGNDGVLQTRIGSTGKGIGAARAERVWRTARRVADLPERFLSRGRGLVIDTQGSLHDLLASNHGYSVLIEGTQGYGLGQHAGYYPTCTSSDCRAIDFLAMAGVSPWTYERTTELVVTVVLRVYPIRVAGASGPMAGETSWEQLGLPEERTTVTHKVRRVGHWDAELAGAAVRANGGQRAEIAVAMLDQLVPELHGETDWEAIWDNDRAREFLLQVQADTGAAVRSIGTGPASTAWAPSRTGAAPVATRENPIRFEVNA